MISQPGVKQAAIIAGVAITYFISARLGLSLATMPEQVTAIWPPAGVGVAALILFGIRAWPGVFLGAFFANAFTNEPLGTALLIGAGNTLECVFAKWTVQRFSQFQPRLNRLADVVLLLGPAALMGGAIGASIGVFSLWMGGLVASPQLGAAWHLWWLGDATGIAIFAPVILTWSQRPAVSASKPGGIEAVLFLSALAAASALIFLSPFEQIRKFNFLLFPFVVWSAYRLGQQWTAAAVVLTSVIAVAGELHQTGASHANLNDRLLLIQVFVGMLALTGFSLGAVVAERRRLQSALEASQQQLEQRVSEKTAELAASRKTLQDFIDNMHTFTAKLDTSGNFLLVGRAAQLASALPQHELMKVNFLEGAWWSFDPEVQHRVKAAFAQTLQGKPVRYEERIWIVSQKCELTINLSLIPVLKADGTVDYVLAEGSDITAQKHAEEQLRQAEQALKASHGELEKRVEERTRDLTAATESLRRSEQWLQAIIDNSNAVVYVKDLEGRYLLVNREWERVNGVPREKAIGRTMFEVYPKDVAEALSKNDRQVAGSEQPFQFEEHVVHPGGTRTYISNKFALRDPGGVPYAICGIATDITLRKESEQREKQAKEMAEAANRSKDEFLAVLSHELRTPLTPILGWTRMLSTGALNGIDTAKGLQAIERNVKAQGQLIEDLLDISRIITGKLKISPR
ncbi:MAG TPA: MASE1 domain-containing protein, partial [Planctomycetota bacterium]|nr:MASE1 domain-containing protein [Planctomycetota bacterium]